MANKLVSMDYKFTNESQLINFAKKFANILSPPIIIGLSGEIGVGKTTFVRAMLQNYDINENIKSPTFSLLESYNNIHHLDLYRLNTAMDFETIGFRDLLTDDVICLIEWPEKFKNILAILDIHLNIDFGDDKDQRFMCADACTKLGEKLLLRLT